MKKTLLLALVLTTSTQAAVLELVLRKTPEFSAIRLERSVRVSLPKLKSISNGKEVSNSTIQTIYDNKTYQISNFAAENLKAEYCKKITPEELYIIDELNNRVIIKNETNTSFEVESLEIQDDQKELSVIKC